MNNLRLITTETFGDLSCEFYRNMNDDILLTREQIGQALEYANPIKAIQSIHNKHKDRLDSLSIRIKSETFDTPQTEVGRNKNLMTERVYYTERGIMEICRWSRQPKANEFMDWVWDIVENYRHNISSSSQMLAETITNLNNTIIKIQEDISLLKENAQKKQLPEKKYSRWKTNTFKKLNILTQYVNEHSDQDLQLRDTIHITIEELEDIYNIDLSDYVQAYKSEFGLEIEPYAIDVIHHYKEIRETYTLILDRIMKKLNLQTENNTISRNIFDTLAAELCND
jgi:prophage antirepressor-like protein